MMRVTIEMMNKRTITPLELVKLPHGEQLAINNICDISLHDGLYLNDVLGVEKLQCNLVLVGQFTKDNNCSLISFT